MGMNQSSKISSSKACHWTWTGSTGLLADLDSEAMLLEQVVTFLQQLETSHRPIQAHRQQAPSPVESKIRTRSALAVKTPKTQMVTG